MNFKIWLENISLRNDLIFNDIDKEQLVMFAYLCCQRISSLFENLNLYVFVDVGRWLENHQSVDLTTLRMYERNLFANYYHDYLKKYLNSAVINLSRTITRVKIRDNAECAGFCAEACVNVAIENKRLKENLPSTTDFEKLKKQEANIQIQILNSLAGNVLHKLTIPEEVILANNPNPTNFQILADALDDESADERIVNAARHATKYSWVIDEILKGGKN